MRLSNYGYTKREVKVREMTIAELKIGVLKALKEKSYEYVNIRVVTLTDGTVDSFKNASDFLMWDINESWKINLINEPKEINVYDEDESLGKITIVITIEDAEYDS